MPPRRAYYGQGAGYKVKRAYKPFKRRISYLTRQEAIDTGLKLAERLVKLDNKFKKMRYIPAKLVDAYNRMHAEHMQLRHHITQIDHDANLQDYHQDL
jgi:hypothetical protein